MLRGIFIVAGHGLGSSGATDNGASGNGTTERKEVLEVAYDLLHRLWVDPDLRSQNVESIGVGIETRMRLIDKISEVNRACGVRGWSKHDALLISVHINAASNPSARGLEAWYSENEATQNFAANLVLQMAHTTGLPLRANPVMPTSANRWGRLGIVDDTTPLACLVECGFISNAEDAAFLKNEQLDDKVAEGLHRGVRTYLGFSAEPGPVTPPPSDFFSDVSPDAWYHDDVKLCLEQGIFTLPPDHLFHPDQPLNRAEAAALIARHLRNHHNITS